MQAGGKAPQGLAVLQEAVARATPVPPHRTVLGSHAARVTPPDMLLHLRRHEGARPYAATRGHCSGQIRQVPPLACTPWHPGTPTTLSTR